MEQTLAIYEQTKRFPREELYGLVSQMRRCAVSIPSNIAEGSQRASNRDFANFILIAKGSLAELQTQTMLAGALEYLPESVQQQLVGEMEQLSKMLYAFHKKLMTHNS